MLYLLILILVLAIGVGWAVAISNKGMPSVKFIFITALLYIGGCLIFSVREIRGWPTNQELPAEFALEAVKISEPRPREDFPGAIYLWVLLKEPANKCPPGLICVTQNDITVPRAYQIDYSMENHQVFFQAQERLARGEMIIVGKNEENDSDRTSNFKFYDLPDIMDNLRK
jgi:hypothetical protein